MQPTTTSLLLLFLVLTFAHGAAIASPESKRETEPDLIGLSVTFTDSSGRELVEIVNRQSFRINVFARDLRTEGNAVGVLSAFADVTYDTTLIDVTNIVFLFDDFTTGMIDDSAGVIKDVGGFENSSVTTREAQLVLYMEAIATAAGSLNITLDSGESVFSENQLFGFDGDLRDRSHYGSGTLEISPATLDIDGNGIIDPDRDGVLILRYMFGFRGELLLENAVDAGCKRCQAGPIEAILASMIP